MGSEARKPAALLLLLVLPLLVLWRPLFLGETFYYQDLAAQYFPTEKLLAREGVSGWNPHIFLGQPLLGNPQTAPYEPIRALCRALHVPVVAGFDVFVAFYLLLASFGAYAFARRRGASGPGGLLCVLAYVYGGVVLLRIRHPWYLVGLALIPWVALACDRLLQRRRLADAVLAAVLIAWAALGGHPQAPYMMWLFAAAYVALLAPMRDWLALGWRLAVGVVIFAGLLGAAYAPVVAHAMHSARHQSSLVFAGSYSWNPWDWVRLLAPDIFGNDMAGTHFGTRNYHEQTIYLGLAPLVLFAWAVFWRLERGLARLSFGAFLLAAGRFLPLFYVFYYVVPGFKEFRAPVRYGAFFALAAAVLASLALTRIANDQPPANPARSARRVRWTCGIIALIFAIAIFVCGSWLDTQTEPGAHTTMRWAAARACVLLIAIGFVIDRWLHGRLPHAATWLVVLTAIDLGAQWLPYRQTKPPQDAFPSPAIERALAGAAPARVFVYDYLPDGEPRTTPLLNWGEAAKFDDVRGYDQLIGADVLALFHKGDLFRGPRDEFYALGPSDPTDWLLDLTGVSRIVAPATEWPLPWRSYRTVTADGGYEVRERTTAMPRVWVVGAVEILPDRAALDRLPTLDARAIATVDADVRLPATPSDDAAGEARLLQSSADDVVVLANAKRPALVVLGDHFDAGWSATVDGAPQPIVRADFVFRGVRIEAGTHRIAFHYQTPGRRLGAIVTACTAPAALLLLLWGCWRRSRSSG